MGIINGICSRSGCGKPVECGDFCREHGGNKREKHAAWNRQRRQQLRAGGLCIRCGEVASDGCYCEKCKANAKERQKTARREKVCGDCGHNLLGMKTAIRQAPPRVRDGIWQKYRDVLSARVLKLHSRYPWAFAFWDSGRKRCLYCMIGQPQFADLVEQGRWAELPHSVLAAMHQEEKGDDVNPWSARAELAAEAVSDWEHGWRPARLRMDAQESLVTMRSLAPEEELDFGQALLDVPADATDFDDVELVLCREGGGF